MDEKNSDVGAFNNNQDKIINLFKNIDKSVSHRVSMGVVTDKITDDFVLKNDGTAEGFRMTLNKEDLAVTYEDGKWNFGGADADGVYPYVVEYDAETKMIIWTLNVPVENTKPITLSYDLILEDENAESGVYPTNKSAVLDYKSSDGKYEGTFTFEIPEVTYVRLIDITVEKLWEDNDDEEEMRPESVTVNLLQNGQKLKSETLNDAGKWQAAFTDLPEAIIEDGEVVPYEYEIEELEVENYDCEIGGSVEDGFVITNAFNYTSPETGDNGLTAYAAVAIAMLLFGAAVVLKKRA